MSVIDRIDKTPIEEYPYTGEFWEQLEPDPMARLLEREAKWRLAWHGKCDIQRNTTAISEKSSTVAYDVFMPMEPLGECPVKRGMIFKGVVSGYEVDGEVLSLEMSMLGGIAVRIKDYTE